MQFKTPRGTAVVAGIALAMGAFAATVEAKGEYDARICGRATCRVVEILPAFGKGGAAPVAVDTPPPPAAFYRIAITYAGTPGATQHVVYVPEPRMINGFGWGWQRSVGASRAR